ARRKDSEVPPNKMRRVGANPTRQPSTAPPAPRRVAARGCFEKRKAAVPASTWKATATSRTSMLRCRLSHAGGGRAHARLDAAHLPHDLFAGGLVRQGFPELAVVQGEGQPREQL